MNIISIKILVLLTIEDAVAGSSFSKTTMLQAAKYDFLFYYIGRGFDTKQIQGGFDKIIYVC